MARICLVSSGAPGSNPRLVKSADALAAAGHDVTVVANARVPNDRDRSVVEGARWAYRGVARGTWWAHLVRATLNRGARLLARLGLPTALDWCESGMARQLESAAGAIPADLYVGHNVPALPAVVRAARRRGVPCVFDLEDDHATEFADLPRWRRSARERLLATHLPACRATTAASPGIAESAAQRFGIDPLVLLNVFPLSERDGVAPPPRGRDGPWRIYWYSQTVGEDRGLGAILRMLGASGIAARMTLRGSADSWVRAKLQSIPVEYPNLQLAFEPLDLPATMTRHAASHDIGVSFEDGLHPHRDLAIANKVFTYVAAGLPVVLSPTQGHRWVAQQLGDGALVLDPSDPAAARGLARWLGDDAAIARRALANWKLAEERFCWERESVKWVQLVARLVG